MIVMFFVAQCPIKIHFPQDIKVNNHTKLSPIQNDLTVGFRWMLELDIINKKKLKIVKIKQKNKIQN